MPCQPGTVLGQACYNSITIISIHFLLSNYLDLKNLLFGYCTPTTSFILDRRILQIYLHFMIYRNWNTSHHSYFSILAIQTGECLHCLLSLTKFGVDCPVTSRFLQVDWYRTSCYTEIPREKSKFSSSEAGAGNLIYFKLSCCD